MCLWFTYELNLRICGSILHRSAQNWLPDTLKAKEDYQQQQQQHWQSERRIHGTPEQNWYQQEYRGP